MNYVDFDKTNALKALEGCPKAKIKDILSADRVKSANIALGGGLTYNWAAMPIDECILKGLQDLSDEMELIEKYKALLSGEMMNPGEKRLVLHQLTRGNVLGSEVLADGENKDDFYKGELANIKDFSEKVRSGEITGSTGKKFNTVCQIGIGGSDLGPRAMYLALKGWAEGKETCWFSRTSVVTLHQEPGCGHI